MAGSDGRTRVALVFGGRSSEHSISCVTAGGILAEIDRERFDVVPVGITREGAFVLERDDPAAFALGGEALPAVRDDGSRVRWPESAVTRELHVRRPDGAVDSLGDVDVAFPILHGRWGEDGTIQGLFELIGLPYAGNGVLASALAMDKHVAKTVLLAAGLEVAPWIAVTRADLADDAFLRRRVAGVGYPAFVKPSRAGSSFGVSRLDDPAGLDHALRFAFEQDDRVLVERAMRGRELEVGLLGSRTGGAPRTSAVGEVVVRDRAFYDFDAKYLGAPGVDLVCPAPLGDGELAEVERVAVRAFEAIGCAGLARVDLFLTGEGVVVNEVNTLPGFTPYSMYPRCWQEAGVAYPRLITELIELAA